MSNSVKPKPETKPLRFWENWAATGELYNGLKELDPIFIRSMGGARFKLLARLVIWPLYFWLRCDGFGLWVEGKKVGYIYLQYKKNLVTHIEAIVLKKEYQGAVHAKFLFSVPLRKAREHGHKYVAGWVSLVNTHIAKFMKEHAQHHLFYEFKGQPDPTPNLPADIKIRLEPLTGKEANSNLQRFSALEHRAEDPEVAVVWEKVYLPLVPSGRGENMFAVYFGDSPSPAGHVNFFDWGYFKSWWLYLEPDRWGSAEEQALLALLFSKVPNPGVLQIRTGTGEHHARIKSFMESLGFVEREEDRMAIIFPLKTKASSSQEGKGKL